MTFAATAACKVQEMLAPADAVKTYILAKDGNRPFLMSRAFGTPVRFCPGDS